MHVPRLGLSNTYVETSPTPQTEWVADLIASSSVTAQLSAHVSTTEFYHLFMYIYIYFFPSRSWDSQGQQQSYCILNT